MKTPNPNKFSKALLTALKEKYDKDFIRYWTAFDKPPKYDPISMEEFKKRLNDLEFFEQYGKLI